MVTSEFIRKPLPATAGERLLELVEGALARVACLWRAARNRRSVAKLLDWDQRMLSDIGLTPGDVRSVMATPLGDDPSYRLSVLSVERRAAVREGSRERLGLARRPAPGRRAVRDAEPGTSRRQFEHLDFET